MFRTRPIMLAPTLLLALLLGACGGEAPPQDGSSSAAPATRTKADADPAPPAQEKLWLIGLRWKGATDQRVQLDITYHLGTQLGTQELSSQQPVQAGWRYLVGSSWVKGMVVKGTLEGGGGPLEAEIIRVRTVGDSPVIESDDDVEVAEVLASMTVPTGGEATMQAGELVDG